MNKIDTFSSQENFLARYHILYHEDTSKTRSPGLCSNLFTFNSQDVLTLDLETEECLIEVNEFGNEGLFDDFEENNSSYSVYLNKGGKRQMEDRYKIAKYEKIGLFFGIFDGHGSAEVAELLAERLDSLILESPEFEFDPKNTIVNCFLKMDQEILGKQSDSGRNIGSVALCCIIRNGLLYVINLGDSKAVLIDNKGEVQNLSNEHIPSRPDEKQMIENLGGVVLKVHDQERVMGELAVSRSFGDKFYKPFVSAMPEVKMYKLEKEEHRLIVLASDGLWNEISNEELGTLVKGKQLEGLAKGIYEGVVEQKSFVMDNLAIVCIDVGRVLDEEKK